MMGNKTGRSKLSPFTKMEILQKSCCMFLLVCLHITINAHYYVLLQNLEMQRRRNRRLLAVLIQEDGPQPIIKSGVACFLLMEMDDGTLRSHIRLNRDQLERLIDKLRLLGLGEDMAAAEGDSTRVSLEIKTLMFLWYMANQNSFRELADKFNVSRSTAHVIVNQILCKICEMSTDYIKWPDRDEKQTSSGVFRRLCGKDRVIGAIDGCHIRIQRPPRHGLDYMNRKGYYSMLLQGICDDQGRFIDIFCGPPGRIHDARLLRLSPFFAHKQEKMGAYRLLGDSAYICNDFAFILAPKRDNGRLTDEERRQNTQLSRGRVVIENVFGRLKCRFRRLRDLQNVRLDIMVRIIVAACTLYNLCMDTDQPIVCDEHPEGCPRENDANNVIP